MEPTEHPRAPPYWEHYPHPADMGVRGVGRGLAEAFEQAALAMMAVIGDPARIRPETAVAIDCQGPDPELLLVDWLNAIVFEMATRGMLFGRFQVSIADGRLQGTAWGEPVAASRHERAVEVKGATYTDLYVGQTRPGTWVAQCIVDV